jgi:outer membrane protein assembly factor BamD (BamD/ComL family)
MHNIEFKVVRASQPNHYVAGFGAQKQSSSLRTINNKFKRLTHSHYGSNFIFILIVLLIISIVTGKNYKKKEAEKKRLYEEYQSALRSGNKAEALAAGRKYYGFLRKGSLTIYDEQAMTNDLSTM